MSARETVLGAVRAALGQATLGRPRPDPAAVAAEARALLADPDAIRPSLPLPDPAAAFAARVVSPKVGATLDRIRDLQELPGAAGVYHLRPPVRPRSRDEAGRGREDSAG